MALKWCCGEPPMQAVEDLSENGLQKDVQWEAPKPCLQITFLTPEGWELDVAFSRKPLGFGFRPGPPVTTTTVDEGSHAEEVGVLPGTEIIAIDGQSIKGMKFQEVVDHIRRRVETLQGEPSTTASESSIH
mmetsp:Transcript_49667/g.144412  ORF Transcript_49667/g.144412 Transcript_49667/m.144412 type:complete len:131 (+) Transcript_49667:97-489(+)